MEANQVVSQRLIVGSGSSVTVWDCAQQNEIISFQPNGDLPIADVAWNHNGQVVASASAISVAEDGHNSITLTAAHSGKRLDSFQHNQAWKRSPGLTASVAFGGKSRYLCVGDDSGAVCMWDLKKKIRVRQFFHENHPSRQVQLDPSDKFIISLSEKLISIFNLREGSLASTITPSGSYAFTCFDVSAGNPSILAVGTSDGNIVLHDITREGAPIVTYLRRCHSTHVTQLAISPQNNQLLASTSIDGTLKFFDMATGETIHQLASLNSAITKLTLHGDGVTCAVGTDKGDIHLYDMRQTEALSSFHLDGPISCLTFAPMPRNKLVDAAAVVSSASNGAPRNLQHVVAPSSSSGAATLARIASTEAAAMPSPVAVDETPEPTHGHPGHEYPTHEHQMATSPVGSSQHVPPTPVHSEDDNAAGLKHIAPASSPGESQIEDVRSASSIGGLAANSALIEINQKLEAVEGVVDILKSTVGYDIDALRDDMEESIRNLHMDMLTQFHQQSQEMKSAFAAQQQMISDLVQENHKLREENQNLQNQV